MALKIVHAFVSAKADGPDNTEVKPSDWNNPHTVETDGAGGIVVGRDTSGPGPMQELPFAYDAVGAIGRWVANVVGSFRLPRGTTGQRPSASQDGEFRFNTDLGVAEMYIAGAWQPLQIGTIQTGMVMGWYLNTLPAGGWLFLNGQTIGNVGSGADHMSAGYQALFTYCYGLDNSICPVSGGRTVDAPTDWGLGKTIQLPDECGTVAAGGDTMGGIVSKKRFDITVNPLGPNGDIPGFTGGENMHTQTIAEMPNHDHDTPGAVNTAGGGSGSPIGFASPLKTGKTGGGAPMNIVQRTIIRNSVIKV